VLSHLRLVERSLATTSANGLPHADLIQEETLGLMKAVKAL
jgi:DNA-directed RNA polymerase sigma subunit (sigma70/sigma32)